MKRTGILIRIALFGLGIVLALICLNGCILDLGGGGDVLSAGELTVSRIDNSSAKIYRPLIGSGDDWNATPRERMLLLWGTGKDQYGNPTGLSNDKAWSIINVIIKCELKGSADTIFNPPYRSGHFWADGIDNACIWYPTWTGPIEGTTGLPFSPYGEQGYPFDPCWSDFADDPQSASGKIYIPEQTALITAQATTDSVLVRITCPAHGKGTYTLDIAGATPQSSNVFKHAFGQSGNYDIVWEYKNETRIYTFLIPEEWFWISGSWSIEVDPQVTCKAPYPWKE